MPEMTKVIFRDGRVYLPDGQEWSVGERKKMEVGELELQSEDRYGLYFARFDQNGDLAYACPILEDGTYKLGRCCVYYVVDSPEDPRSLRGVLLERGIPLIRLKRFAAGQPLRARVRSTWNENAVRWDWYTDGEVEVQSVSSNETDWKETRLITEASWAIEIYECILPENKTEKMVNTIVIWPGCTPQTLANALDSLIFETEETGTNGKQSERK